MKLSTGNRKLQKEFLIFNLPTKITCPGKTKLCQEACYASKAERIYPETLPSRMNNFDRSKEENFADFAVPAIKEARGPNRSYFRIHESGDFYSQEYFDKWCKVAKAIPDMIFLAYTKNYNLDLKSKPGNFKLYWSVFPDTDLSKVPDKGYRAYTYGIRKGVQYNITGDNRFDKAFVCDGLKCLDCKVCFEKDLDVKFPFH